MNLTKSTSRLMILRSPQVTIRHYCKEEKPPSIAVSSKVPPVKSKEEKLSEFDSYEKWLKSVQSSLQKDAKSKLKHLQETVANYPIKESVKTQVDHLKDSFVTWRLGQAHNEEWYAERLSFWMKRYENFVGLTEVKASQALVVKEVRMFQN